MSPQEISEHKMRWKRDGCYIVRLHSDLRSSGKDWCKMNMLAEHYDNKNYTDNYEDSYYFEFEEDAIAFKNYERHVPYVDLKCI
mgnify:CR=1 FL=1